MIDLLDINVWLALTEENHAHHARAAQYWQHDAQEEIAFCRTTMLGFLRLCTHPKVLSRPLSVNEAWAAYHTYREQSGVSFLTDSDTADAVFKDFTLQDFWGHHLWTDASLAGFARQFAARLVSFDADFAQFSGLDFLQLSSN